MRKLLFILALAILPALTFAQGAGGQIKRPVKKTTSTTKPHTSKKNTSAPPKSESKPSAPSFISSEQALSEFFPIYGITIGETTFDEAKRLGADVRDGSTGGKYATVKHYALFGEFTLSRNSFPRGIIDYVSFDNPNGNNYWDFPPLWKSKGFDWDNSYDKWYNLFKTLGFDIEVTKSPRTTVYKGVNTLEAEFYANASDGLIKFRLNFCYNGEKGCKTSSPGTLHSITCDRK